MKRLLTFLLVATTAGFLSAATVSTERTRTSALTSILNRQEDKINRAYQLRYISYNEYENLYYQLEDIEDYKFRAFRDRRIDFREERILNELIYNLDSRLDRIFYRKAFCGNYYQPVYLRSHHYTNHYHHYRRPRVTFSVNINGGNYYHPQPHYNQKYYRNQRYDTRYNRDNRSYNSKDRRYNEYRKDRDDRGRRESTRREYRSSNKSRNYTKKDITVSKQNNKRRVYNQRS